MTLPTSPPIDLIEIIEEVYGVGVTDKDLVACGDDSNPSVGSAPYDILDFLGHTQDWGRSYSELGISYTAYIERLTHGGQYLMDSGPSLEFTGDRDESAAVYKDTSQTPIGAGETITLKLYRRAKQSGDSWVLSTTINTYTSGSFSLTFTVYDYKIRLESDP